MKTNSWFRMYSEFASDPKVQSMTEVMQRRLLMLLCLRCSNALVTLQRDEVTFALRISEEELAETISLFERKGFIDSDLNILNWDKRQFNSDSSTARVSKHREKQKHTVKQPCNVSVTPPEQNRTEQNRTDKPIMSSSTNIDPEKLARLKLNRENVTQAKDVLAYLNKNAGKNFREVDSTLSQIIARLKEGYTAERLREIAYYKIEQWGTDEKMAEYLRPATLYNKTNCAQYDGEL